MTQIFLASKDNAKQLKTYCYTNNLTRVVIAKIKGLKNRQWERVIFPQEKFLFTAHDHCQLEIHQQTNVGIIQDLIDCRELQTINL